MSAISPDDVLAESEQIRRERVLLLEDRSGAYLAAKGRLLGEDPDDCPCVQQPDPCAPCARQYGLSA